MNIKLSDAQMKALGNPQNANDTLAAIDALVTDKAKAKTDADNMAQAIAQSGESMKALEARLAAVEKKELTISEADRKTIVEAATAEAKKEAGSAVSAAIAKVGVQAVSGGQQADDKADKLAKVDEKAEDAEAIWTANANIRDEFITKESWLAYHKANKAGLVAFAKTKGA